MPPPPREVPMWYPDRGDWAQRVAESHVSDDDDDDDDEDATVKFFNNVPKGRQPAKAGTEHEEKEMQKPREKDAYNKKKGKKMPTVADLAERRNTENAAEEEDRDIAEDDEHPVHVIGKVRLLRPTLKLVAAPKQKAGAEICHTDLNSRVESDRSRLEEIVR